jgi:hypothetical protein
MTERQLSVLESIHSENRIHVCEDGYRWQVIQEEGYCIGNLWAPDGSIVARIQEPKRFFAERYILKVLDWHRRNHM